MRKFVLLASLAFVLGHSGVGRAAVVSTILTLDAATPTVNTFNLSPGAGLVGTSALSGTMNADINYDVSTGAISWINLTGGNIAGTAWSIPLAGINATASTASADTIPGAPSFSPVTGTSFDATQHRIQLLTGTATSSEGTVNLAGTNIEGTGMGTLTSTRNGELYDIVFSMNVNDSEPLGSGTLGITGTVVARGAVTAIPEPTSVFALTALVGCVALRRRRR